MSSLNDIRSQALNLETPDFKKVMRGYDPEVVDQAWAEADRQQSETTAANKELRLQINSLREQNSEWGNRLQSYEQIEKDLRDALLSAQRVANQVRAEATKEAAELLESAQRESAIILSEATRIKELQEVEAEASLSDKRIEIIKLEQQLQGLAERKIELQTLVDQSILYLDMVKELLERSTTSNTND